MAQLTPMMQQYLEIKRQHEDTIVFYRLGDFYEMFFEDAILASKELEIALTGRDCGLAERAPMCGVPYHAMDIYLNKLLEKGYRVAICEQTSDPVVGKGIVERAVTRIVTPGTVIEANLLDEKKNNFIASICLEGKKGGLAYADVSTGDFFIEEFDSDAVEVRIQEELARIAPTEIIVNEATAAQENRMGVLRRVTPLPVGKRQDWSYGQDDAHKRLCKHFEVGSLAGFGCDEMDLAVRAAGGLLCYLEETQRNSLRHIRAIKPYRQEQFMVLDVATRRNLELTATLQGKGKRGSLLWLLDRTETAMGGRQLRRWLEQPLQDEKAITSRLNAVEELLQQGALRQEIGQQLKQIYDIERLCSRIAYGSINPRDALSLAQSLQRLPRLDSLIGVMRNEQYQQIAKEFDSLEDLSILLNRAIAQNPPILIKEGGIIAKGYDEKLDQLRQAETQGIEWISALEASERQATGIKTLKVGYNRIFGYYIEVTKSNLGQVPYRYIRKQTLANAERYSTPELKQIEETIVGAQEKAIMLEYELFCAIRQKLAENIERLQRTASCIARIDSLYSLATVAFHNDYCKPSINAQGIIDIQNGRHPVVEKTLDQAFVPNDALLDNQDRRMVIITGPNMAGKSTYMRQIALMTLMAHIGSFIPAQSADIALTDRIFTRVGASDDLSAGQSTFMVEMSEVANILHHATSKSLIILDEIGRGTSTFDGLSIAWAVAEYICDADTIGAKTLFATHYHELSELEGKQPGVINQCVSVREYGEDIIFLRKIIPGGADKSFGIEVARLAGLPPKVLQRARQILRTLEQVDINRPTLMEKLENYAQPDDASLMSSGGAIPPGLLDEIAQINIAQITPIQAMSCIDRWQQEIVQARRV